VRPGPCNFKNGKITRLAPAIPGLVAVSGCLGGISRRELPRGEIALAGRNAIFQLHDAKTRPLGCRLLLIHLHGFSPVSGIDLTVRNVKRERDSERDYLFCPGGAWPAGLVAGMPLASPFGVLPPPFTWVMVGAMRSSSRTMVKRLVSAGVFVVFMTFSVGHLARFKVVGGDEVAHTLRGATTRAAPCRSRTRGHRNECGW